MRRDNSSRSRTRANGGAGLRWSRCELGCCDARAISGRGAKPPPARIIEPGVTHRTRILVLGGGFGGVYTALHLERAFRRDPAVEITLVSRDNFFLYTPMLHEVASCDVDITHIVSPLRALLRRTSI